MNATNGANEMDHDARSVSRANARSDGLAAVAITLLAAALIVFLISQIV